MAIEPQALIREENLKNANLGELIATLETLSAHLDESLEQEWAYYADKYGVGEATQAADIAVGRVMLSESLRHIVWGVYRRYSEKGQRYRK